MIFWDDPQRFLEQAKNKQTVVQTVSSMFSNIRNKTTKKKKLTRWFIHILFIPDVHILFFFLEILAFPILLFCSSASILGY